MEKPHLLETSFKPAQFPAEDSSKIFVWKFVNPWVWNDAHIWNSFLN